MSDPSDPLKGISTPGLEARIEALLAECGPRQPGEVSFGVNTAQWRLLEAAVLEYIRMHRNARGRSNP